MNKIFGSITVFQFILILALLLIFFYFLSIGKIDKKIVFVGLAVFLVVFFFLYKTKQEKLITEEHAKLIAYESFRNKMGNEFPTGTHITVGPHCKRRKWGDRWYKWEIQVTLKYPDGNVKEKMLELDVYTGEILGIVEMPTGYTGRDSPDIKPVYMYDYFGKAEGGSPANQ